MKKLTTTGYHTLKPGRIHLFCPGCARKRSNVPREFYDPDRAMFVSVLCPTCVDALCAHEPIPEYFDILGEPVDMFEDERKIVIE